MKPFNLEEYLKNPSRKVVMRDGRPVRIVCTDRKGGGEQPIVALYPASQKYLGELVSTFCANGEFTMGIKSKCDLFFAPEKHEKWINIYRDTTGISSGTLLYDSREGAEEIGKFSPHYMATAKVEWEE